MRYYDIGVDSMGKNLDAFIKRQKTFYRNRRLQRYKSPFDCPKCYGNRQLIITRKKEGEDMIWRAACGSCDYILKFDSLPEITEAIDIFNKVCDKVRGGTL